MANTYSPASTDLGLTGNAGDALTQQVDDDEEQRKKKLLGLGGAQPGQAAANSMGLAAMNLLGAFRG